jgi:hypothetical protein
MKRQRKEYLTRREKTVDFLIGFIGWFILNGLWWGGLSLASWLLLQFSDTPAGTDLTQFLESIGEVATAVLLILPLILNLALLIRFAFTRYWIAIGAASAFASLLLLTICAGIVWTVACFVLLSNSGF